MPNKGDITFDGWPAGINNVAKDTAVPATALRDAVNVDLDNAGKPSRRQGRSRIVAGVRSHSVFNSVCGPVYVEGSVLRRLLPDYSTVDLGDLGSADRVCYETVNGETYLTNGRDVWRLFANGALVKNGVPTPSGQPLLSFTSDSGALSPGRYLIALTYVDSSGEESAASLAVEATTSAVGTLVLESIPQSDEAAYVRVYMTETNGTVLREVAEFPMGVTVYNLSRTIHGRVLDTQFYDRLPGGQIIRYYRGRLFVARGSILYYTDAMRMGLYRQAENYIQFPGPISIVQPVFDGLYVAADQTYFLAGNDPKSMQQIIVDDAQGIPHTGMTVDASTFSEDATGEAAYWYTNKGATLGFPGGTVQRLMEQTVALPSYEEGASIMREQNGMRHAVTALRGSGTDAAFALGDEISVTVKRNGIVL